MESGGLDCSGKGNHLTNYGTTFQHGKVGNCADFDGVDDRLDGGNILNLGEDEWFISFWINPNSTTGIQAIFGKAIAAAATHRYSLTYQNNTIVLFYTESIRKSVPASYTPVGEWTYIECQFNRNIFGGYLNLGINLWINMNLVIDYNPYGISYDNNFISPFPFRIGCYTANNPPTYSPSLFFNGKIDEFLIYNKRMSDSDRKRIYLGMHPLNG
ncbi:MAG: LamG domain-containing protein [Bacteroidales bacterium]|nr:LamG domain-containing protein [Bacteroidales bacterium]